MSRAPLEETNQRNKDRRASRNDPLNNLHDRPPALPLSSNLSLGGGAVGAGGGHRDELGVRVRDATDKGQRDRLAKFPIDGSTEAAYAERPC